MYFYGYRQHQPHAFVNKQTIIINKQLCIKFVTHHKGQYILNETLYQ